MGASRPIRIVLEEFDEDEEEHPAASASTATMATTAERPAIFDFIGAP
jgi:hypothetical protein